MALNTSPSLLNLIPTLGTTDWPLALLQFVDEQLGADHLSLFFFDQNFVPCVADAVSKGGGDLAWLAGQDYTQSV